MVRAASPCRPVPGDPVLLVRGDTRLDPFALVRQVADGALTDAAWQALCAGHGLGAPPLSGPGAAAA